MAVVNDFNRHHLTLGSEGHFIHPRESVLAFVIEFQLACGHQERGFSRVTHDMPRATVGLLNVRVAGQVAAAENHGLFFMHGPARQFGSAKFDLSFGRVANTRDVRAARCRDHPLDGHLGAGQGTGFVRGNHRRAAQSFHRRKALHDGVVPDHALNTQRQHQRQDGGQPLRHGCYRQRHTQQQHRHHICRTANIRHQQNSAHHQHGNRHHCQAQLTSGAGHFFLQRRQLWRRGFEQVCNVTHLSVHAGGGDNRAPTALRHRRARKNHVCSVSQRSGVGQGGGVFQRRFAFTGE